MAKTLTPIAMSDRLEPRLPWLDFAPSCPHLVRLVGFLAAILLTVAFAALVPARGDAAMTAGWLTDAAIALRFFMRGAKISPDVALQGARQWRLSEAEQCQRRVPSRL